MAISNWLCTNNSKNQFVKIVHPGGHIELHDRPILASEIILRNPRSCITHPNIFKQPSAIVYPETTLNLGEKFYVVPISTIRKLQRISARKSQSQSPSPSPVGEIRNESASGKISRVWFGNKRNLNLPCSCWKDWEEDRRENWEPNLVSICEEHNKHVVCVEDCS